MKRYLKYLLLFFLIFTPVYALENYETQFNNSIPDYIQRLSNQSCQNVKPYDYINQIIEDVDFSTSVYQMYVGTPSTNFVDIYFYLSTTEFDEITYYANSSKSMFLKSQPVISFNARFTLRFGYSGSCPSGNPFEQNFYLHLIDFIQNGNTQWLGSSSYFGNLMAINTTFESQDSGYSIVANNNSNYNTDWWFYYSSRKLYLSDDDYSGDSYFHKNVYITNNDLLIEPGDFAPSYYNIYVSPPEPEPSEPTFIGYKTSLDTFYTNLSPSDFSYYSFKINFRVPQSLLGSYQTTQEYIDNTNFNYYCSGRVNHSNYYTYESFPCSLTTSYTKTDSNIEYTFNNLSTSSSISSYDKIYITINTIYLDKDINTIVYDFIYYYNLGSYFNTDFKGLIYEDFTSLPLNFRLYLSSNNNNDSSLVYSRKSDFINYNIKYIGFSNTTTNQNLVIGQSLLGSNGEQVDFIKINVSNNIDTGIMIYQDNSSILLPRFDLFINNGIVISFNNNSSSDVFYYVDNNGDIVSNDFIKPLIQSNNNYDISYYIGRVISFIDDLSNDCLTLSQLTQTFYNGMPIIFQTFIFVLFILGCIYFTYLIIKR